MQWSIFIPQSDVIDTGSLGPCARLQFELPKMVLKTAKAKACATKTQCAILSRSGACQLARARQVGSISPNSESNSESQQALRESCSMINCKLPGFSRQFFLPQEKFALGTVVSHFVSELFSGREIFGGRSKLDERQSFTTLHSQNNENQFGDECVSIVSESNSGSAQFCATHVTKFGARATSCPRKTSEARWHARTVSLQKVLLWMEQSNSHSIWTFEAASVGGCPIVSTSSCNCNSSH